MIVAEFLISFVLPAAILAFVVLQALNVIPHRERWAGPRCCDGIGKHW